MNGISREDDLMLLRGCLQNDRKVQEQLYRKYFKTMYQICISYSGDRVEAKDILQDAFVKVFTSLEKFDAKGSLEGWVRRIVTNTAIDHLRKKREELCSLMASPKNRKMKKEAAVFSGNYQQILFSASSDNFLTGQE